MSAEHDGPEGRFERAFAEALGRAGEAYDTEPGPLVDTGWSYGRRLRRRRRIGTVAGVAALALVGVGAAGIGGLLPGLGPTSASSVSSGAAVGRPVSGTEFQRMLTELLPPGTVQVGEARGTESDIPQLRLVLDDGNGPVQYLFWIMRNGVEPGCLGPLPGDACSETDLPGGEHLTLYQAGTRPGEPAGSKTWSATLTGTGYEILLQEWNRKPLDQGTPITRTDPPLTPDQLAAVVKDPRWKKVVAALPKGPVMGVVVTPAPGAASTYVPDSVVTGPVTLPAFPKPGS
ncbi:hypothetical protein ACFU7Z_11385 [Kitasatospora sp. NPDC057518]|uniref:hypothetical protein n=1 Tax=Kitasatospora sp. NPDC057518 TaxID=3346155 RepID=UPI0036C8B25E